MSDEPYYPSRIRRWIEIFFRPIRVVIPTVFEGSIRDNLGMPPAGTSNKTGPPSTLDKHMDRRHQLKRIRYHPSLLGILVKKLDDQVATLPQDLRIDSIEEEPQDYSVEYRSLRAADNANLHMCALSLLKPATEISSILLFLREETSSVHHVCFPVGVSTSNLDIDTPNHWHDVIFHSEYNEYEGFRPGESHHGPLKTATVKAIKYFRAAFTYLK
jgi:hypothetical protein